MKADRKARSVETPTPLPHRGTALSESPQPPPSTATKPSNGEAIYRAVWVCVNAALAVAILLALYSIGWEYSTRRYLKGFSDAVIPVSATPLDKAEAILNWMAHGPARKTAGPDGKAPDRDPTETLNYYALLKVCGSATNAFINLADSSGLEARRLLLLDSRRLAKHVSAEVLIEGRWIVVDPAFRVIFRGPDGTTLTRSQLADPATFAAATRNIPGYDPNYSYESTVHLRLGRLRFIGKPLRWTLDHLAPHWEESGTASLLVERSSFAAACATLLLVLSLFGLRLAVRRYGESHLGVHSVRIRRQVQRALQSFVDTAG
ncbi:MAG TPA: transglutaminase domain-containing protein [archaeon]|nr:transglutaminase domain-containing protein [archaeon]